MAKPFTPRSPEEITPDWLTAALRENNVIDDAAITDISTEPIGAGAGFLGQLAKLTLTYDRDESGAPRSLIAKLPTLDPGGREIGNLFRFYEREIRFYEDLAPVIDMGVPKRYYSAMDIAGDEYLLLIEDLAPAIVGDEASGVSIEAAELAIRSLAKFQAGWWGAPKLDELEWMPMVNAPVHQQAQGSYQQAWEPFCQMFGDRISPAMLQIGDEMRDHVIDLLNYHEPAPRTIIHGDFRGDNVFYGAGAPGTKDFYAIDWQISSRGRGIFDVAYFLCSSVDPAIRKAHEMRLIRLWHDIIGEKADLSNYPYEQAVEDYRVSALYMHVYTVIGLGSLDFSNERGLLLFNEWLRRRSTAIEELDCGELRAKVWSA
jgi:hypothetical protein